MAKDASYGTTTATAPIAWPVLAQTAGKSPPSSSPGMTPRHSATPGIQTSAAIAPTAPTYFTESHQVRVSEPIGSSVYNEQNMRIGSIDGVPMGDYDRKADTMVISGGFLGMGSKLVPVPFDQLRIESDKIVMPGAT
jgi:hypothetical protein